MNYGELRAHFLDVLNRSDCTNEQADTFITMGLRRAERLLRTPIQKTTLEKTVDGTWPGYEPIPGDYLGIYSIAIDGTPVLRIDQTQKGLMNGWFIEGGELFFSPDLKEGQTLKMVYYNEFSKGPSDSAVTDYSAIFPDITTYAALVFACDTFLDERKPSFEATLKELLQETQMFADMDEMAGVVAITPYGGGIA